MVNFSVSPSSSPLPIEKLEAGASVSKKGAAISKGRSVTRLKWGDDPRFYVAANIVKSGNLTAYISGKIGQLLGFYAEIKDGSDTVFVNINSLASRLHIKKSTIRKASKQGTLPSLFNQSLDKSKQTIDGYEKIVNKVGDISISRDLTKTLMKVVRTAVTSDQPVFTPIQIGQHTYHVGFDKDNKEIELAAFGAVFGKGTFGEVKVATHIFEGTEEVLKLAQTDDKDLATQAKKDVENEYQLLSEIHQDGQVWGIQAKPTRFVEIREGNMTQIGYMGLKYDGDYLSHITNKQTRKFEDFLIDFHQLLSGLSECEKRDILHGDLKPENILAKQETDGTTLVHIADLGGARRALPDASLKELAGGGGTRAFTSNHSPLTDIRKSLVLALMSERNQLVALEKKRDVFSMGTILQTALTGTAPFDCPKTLYGTFPDLQTYKPIANPDVPQEMRALIESMLAEDPEQRPMAQQAFAAYEAFLATKHPAVLAQIRAKIAAEYPGSLQK